MVHWGTLLAVVAYFWKDWWTIASTGLRGLLRWDWSDPRSRMLWLLVLGSVPAALLGYFLDDFFESLFAQPTWVSIFLLVTAVLLAASEWMASQKREARDLRWQDALIIGLSQAAAIAPGISRSGATISAGLWRGLDRAEAARFSFLLGTPIIFGAGLFQLLDLLSMPNAEAQVSILVTGFVAAAISGYVCIGTLLRYLRRGRLYPFAVYCALAGTFFLLVAILR